MNSNWFKILLRITKVKYGKNLLLKGCPVIFNMSGASLTIGNNVTVKSSFLSNLVGLYSRTIIVTRAHDAEIVIGDNVGISGATIYARSKIEIGKNTCIGGNAKILDNDFHPIDVKTRNRLMNDPNGGNSALVPAKSIKIGENCFIGCNSIILKGTILGDGCVVGAGAVVSITRNRLMNDPNGGNSALVPAKSIKIGENCFIGCNSIILKGTILGDGCVVGAGAVVSGKFEDNCVIVGNPAKVIKKLKEEVF